MAATRITAVILACTLPAAAMAAHNDPLRAAKLVEMIKDDNAPLILDVRTKWEYEAGHVPGAMHVPHTRLGARLGDIPAGEQDRIVVYCEQGPRAHRAERILESAGYTRVQPLQGHMASWRKKSYPTQ